MDTTIISLKEGWKFHYGDVPEAWYRGFDDSGWEEVFLPHDWSVRLPFQKEYSSGTGYLAGGIGWYRVRFSLPEELRGKCVRVVFDGIYCKSRLWCNSYHLGKRPYGYSEISYDLSELVHFGDTENEISVRVDRTELADSRWFTGSGIYRKAYLVIEEPVHLAWHGTWFRTEFSGAGEVKAVLESEIAGAAGAGRVEVMWRLRTPEGDEAVCWQAEAERTSEAGESRTAKLTALLPGAERWSVERPYLYMLETLLRVDGGEWYLAGNERVGVRDFCFDAERGFFLNGLETKIKGVCVHHDGGCLGAAMYRDVWLRRLLKLKKAGCNAIRMSHNPHMPELYDLCDELGFLVMDEAFDEWENPKNKWSTGHNVYPPKHQGYAEDFPQWHEEDLVTMLRRDRNHPCIVMWSIGNEIDYPNDPYCHESFATMTGNNDANKPAAERAYNADKPNARRLPVIAGHLAGIVKRQDPSRPVTLAAAFPELSSRLGFFDALDVVGYNYKEHLYEEDHRRFPEKPLLGSENSHSYQAWKAVTEHPYISGQFLWTGIDYLGEAHGWPVHGSPAGILDLAGYEKPGYFRRKAFWSEPALCLLAAPDDGKAGEWKPLTDAWDFAAGEPVLLRCFGAEEAELFLNGVSLGRQTVQTDFGCLEWHTVFQPGRLEAVGTAAGQTLRCLAETPSEAVELRAEVWSAQKECREDGEKAGCALALENRAREVAQIEVSLRDACGRLVTRQDRPVYASVEHGVLLGLESGDLKDLTAYSEPWRQTHRGRLIVYVKPGKNCRVRLTCGEWEKTIALSE